VLGTLATDVVVWHLVSLQLKLRGQEIAHDTEREKEQNSVCTCVCVCVCERERESQCGRILSASLSLLHRCLMLCPNLTNATIISKQHTTQGEGTERTQER